MHPQIQGGVRRTVKYDGQEEEVNGIIGSAHNTLKFIVDAVTSDSMEYMALGNGLAMQEDVGSSSDEVNDGGDENGKDGNKWNKQDRILIIKEISEERK